jgi:hypothetical protein
MPPPNSGICQGIRDQLPVLPLSDLLNAFDFIGGFSHPKWLDWSSMGLVMAQEIVRENI